MPISAPSIKAPSTRASVRPSSSKSTHADGAPRRRSISRLGFKEKKKNIEGWGDWTKSWFIAKKPSLGKRMIGKKASSTLLGSTWNNGCWAVTSTFDWTTKTAVPSVIGGIRYAFTSAASIAGETTKTYNDTVGPGQHVEGKDISDEDLEEDEGSDWDSGIGSEDDEEDEKWEKGRRESRSGRETDCTEASRSQTPITSKNLKSLNRQSSETDTEIRPSRHDSFRDTSIPSVLSSRDRQFPRRKSPSSRTSQPINTAKQLPSGPLTPIELWELSNPGTEKS